PDSTQELAHLREASGPSPLRTMSSTPAIAACGSASAIPAAAVIGQASKHLPQRVQASSISSTRARKALSKASGMVPSWWRLLLIQPRSGQAALQLGKRGQALARPPVVGG